MNSSGGIVLFGIRKIRTRSTAVERAPLEIRLVLRRFLSAARLPLAGEKTGPIFYLLLYLICEVALWFEFVIPARLLF